MGQQRIDVATRPRRKRLAFMEECGRAGFANHDIRFTFRWVIEKADTGYRLYRCNLGTELLLFTSAETAPSQSDSRFMRQMDSVSARTKIARAKKQPIWNTRFGAAGSGCRQSLEEIQASREAAGARANAVARSTDRMGLLT
jgi:hypothetical protein